MALFLQQVFNGIMLGSTYAIVALGLTLVFGILHIPNFAHGHLYMLGAYIGFFLMTLYGFGFWTALIASMIILALVGMLVERIVYRPLQNRPVINSFISAVGALMILETGVIVLWGPQGRRIPNPYPGIVDLLGITMTWQRLLVILVAIVLIILLQIFIKKTTVGTTIEAVAQNREGAMLVGINVNWVFSLTFAISTATAAAAACLVAPIFMISPTMGALLGMKAFVIVILGGLGSIPGAILGGYILGLLEAIGGGYLSAAYKDVYAFGALILILSIRPTGLFGREVS
ncbi:MAG TPA: branched-chain amino acid ABC transporter permease [Thermodesulfobacteriota bacterium]|nr:branched-chain amino acid ABC transporter permease [Thermodesulfobacteriota bacterium]